MLSKKTKIVSSIGPASESAECVESIIKAGANVLRFNMKHEPAENYRPRVTRAQEVIKKMGVNVAIMFDLQGPDIRVDTKNEAKIELAKGEKVFFGAEFNDDEKCVRLPHAVIFEELNVGDSLLIDDGFFEFKVAEKLPNGVMVEALEDSYIKHRKGLNIPKKKLSKIPSLTKEDLEKLDLAAELKPDFVAISFCRSKSDVEIAREELNKRGLKSQIVAKIENEEGLNNLDEIIDAADVIMVARGDLGVEIPFEKIASIQREMVEKCREKNKPVITATQMLESMSDNIRPTRAEVTDVSNAVMYGTDATMLSGETAAGKHPAKCVETMARIAKYNEEFAPALLPEETSVIANNVSQLLARTCVSMILDNHDCNINKIIAITDSGYTARVLSSYRLSTEIIAVTNEETTAKTLAISYGVNAAHIAYKSQEIGTRLDYILNELKNKGYIEAGERVALLCGQQLEIHNLDNSIKIIDVK